MFTQTLVPLGSLWLTVLVAFVPLVVLLALLAGLRMTAWLATLIAGVVTAAIAIVIWHTPPALVGRAYVYGGLQGVWAVDWITFWGLIIFNTLVSTGDFDNFKRWLIHHATSDVRIQTLMLAWAFGALLEGLVGFGYPWAVIAPILIGVGIADLDAIRVAALANNAPVSYGALGAPLIALAAVTGLPLLSVSASVGHIVAVLALLPPWVLLFLVSGAEGVREAWPLAIVGSLSYIAGPVAGRRVPRTVPARTSPARSCRSGCSLPSRRCGGRKRSAALAAWPSCRAMGAQSALDVAPIDAGPRSARGCRISSLCWSSSRGPARGRICPDYSLLKLSVQRISSITQRPEASTFNLNPLSPGTAILGSWLVILALLRPGVDTMKQVFARTWHQMWGALLVGFFIFGLAFSFVYSGMANSMAYGCSKVGLAFIVLAPILGWVGVALSGSNTSTNAMFGPVQAVTGRLLHLPPLMLPSFNSVGAEVGKPIAPQTASVGVSTSRFVRSEGDVIRHNMAWTLVVLAYLVLISIAFYFFAPDLMTV